MSDKDNINPEEMQKELEDLVKSKFGDKIKFVSNIDNDFDPLAKDDVDAEEAEPVKLDFDYFPKDVFNYLEGFVIGQHSAKKTLAIAICDHYNHIKKNKLES